MKAILRQWSERIRSWLENLRKIQPQRRTPGIVAVPGQMRTLMGGKFKIPKIDWDKLYRKSFVYNSFAAIICGYFVADLFVAVMNSRRPQGGQP